MSGSQFNRTTTLAGVLFVKSQVWLYTELDNMKFSYQHKICDNLSFFPI